MCSTDTGENILWGKMGYSGVRWGIYYNVSKYRGRVIIIIRMYVYGGMSGMEGKRGMGECVNEYGTP